MHSIRVAFDESKAEEIFSYMTVTNIFRKVFGPIIRSEKEVFVFFGLMGGYFFSQISFILSNKAFFSYIASFFGFLVLSILSFGIARLFFVRRKLKRAFKKLFKIFKFSKMKKDEIKDYFFKSKELPLRLRLIYISYFKPLL